MGVILDSSVIISAERSGATSSQLIRRLLSLLGDQEIALSAIGYTELIHGIHRDQGNPRHRLAREFILEISAQMPIYPYTSQTAELAGKIDAEQRLGGMTIPFADLLIGATALSLGFSVLTLNERHFRVIPGLTVLSFTTE